MILRELLDDPGLGLTLLHGTEALDQPVTSAFTTDLRDPRHYVRPGDLVLTGLMWRRTPADSDAFVSAVVDSGAIAIAAGEAALGEVPDDVAAACRHHGVTLFRVPVEVSFGQISDRVSTAREAEQRRALATALGRQRQLLSAVAEGHSLDELLALARDELGVGCHVRTPTGRLVAAAPGAPAPASTGMPAQRSARPDTPGHTGDMPAADVDRLTRTFLTAGRLPVTVSLSDGSSTSIFPVEPRIDARVASWFLVCTGEHEHWPEDVHASLRELASVILLERHRWEERRRSQQRIADDVLAALAEGHTSGAELTVRMADLGIDPAGPFVVAIAAPAGTPARTAAHGSARAALDDAMLHVTDHPISGIRGDRAIAIATGHPAATGTLRTALERLAPAFDRERLLVGVCTAADFETLSGALDGAHHATNVAATWPARVSVVSLDDVASHAALLAALPDSLRRTFATRILQPVFDYDEHHGGELIPTLEAFLDADGSWSSCARRLHVHVNTVRYRLQRIAELTGRDLSRLENRVDVFLALKVARPGS
ncbi:PucR family transcriptional regulator [Actinobacteria bacterium YIM 96077]|uniref:PucR family transcriptional regulator n=1 Tax=Phytoactinopolyspora halophila TaxID=1981511 RepID=A0A329R735_9ACTN|nr:helix-turn-helix domain-containing protein [Phytoactinopolyspora halophila]AYY11879.1 PucR family transcriptional regulator [Actinobacteria bacterium YIM 96077]RAW18888.1 PucR family transcriptional regulator [Phytoactinopolyspora halophila]